MRRPVPFPVFLLAASCWLAAGPGGVTVEAMMACRHQHIHQLPHGHHPGAPADGPCFCDEMTGGTAQVLSPAAPVHVAVLPPVAPPVPVPADAFQPPLPPSPAFPPTPHPPDGLV